MQKKNATQGNTRGSTEVLHEHTQHTQFTERATTQQAIKKKKKTTMNTHANRQSPQPGKHASTKAFGGGGIDIQTNEITVVAPHTTQLHTHECGQGSATT